uniref:Pentacotripeptide-repeat region of PRORP domain-containing protein n=1 Tax=Rhizochromulina marina TaxID=1034831 RepID=A0A7S2W4P8_9STRA|mmetsp:Transcript_14173/g.41758  ORF Transcript_14173/g.41758 Transcript_14173/m.41758 type:complete len:148 (+) Transcript_14173:3-446(+)
MERMDTLLQQSQHTRPSIATLLRTAVSLTFAGEDHRADTVEDLLHVLRRHGRTPRTRDLNSAVRSLSQDPSTAHAALAGVLHLSIDRKTRAVPPDLATFHVAMQAAGRAGKAELGLSLLEQMREEGLEPTAVTMDITRGLLGDRPSS